MKRYSDSVADNTLLVSQNVTNLMNDIRAEDLLNDAVYYIDARDASASGQTIDNLGTAKELLPTTLGSSTSADSNDPKFLDHTGTNYIYNPGVVNNALTVPYSANLAITGDLDLRAYVAMDEWKPTPTNFLVARDDGASQRCYSLGIANGGSGILSFAWSTDGTSGTRTLVLSTAAPTITNGSPLWVRATLDVDNGAGGRDIRFFTSTDGVTWTQLGTTVTQAGTTSVFGGTTLVTIGGNNGGAGTQGPGKVFRAQIFNGIDGTKVLDVDTSVLKTGAETSFTALTGQTVTINRSTSGRKTVAVTQPCWLFGTDDYMEVNNRYMSSGTYLYLPGISGNSASAPDSAALSVTGDIDIRAKIALDDWTPSGTATIIAKLLTSYSYRLTVLSTGPLQFGFSLNGADFLFSNSTVSPGFTDGATKWIRATRVASTGVITFFTSDDGTTWTQLGTTVTNTSGNIFDGTGSLEIGVWNTNTEPARGKFFRAMVFNGIDGTKVFDADFENKITSLEQASFVERSTNAATVTINRSGSTYRSAGITAAGYLYPGATNTFAASATSFLDFEAADSFTLLAVVRTWNTQNSFRDYLGKTSSVGGVGSWTLESNSTTLGSQFWITSTGVAGGTTTTARSNGEFAVLAGVANRTTNLFFLNQNGVPSSTGSLVGVGAISNFGTVQFGRDTGGFQDFELIAGAVFRRALTSAEITLITNYFNRRSL